MVLIVNMIPNAISFETNQDSEPNLTVNPANPLQIAGSAFTPDPLGGANAPIFVSTDGGNTWVLNGIVPSLNGQSTSDITLRFASSGNRLYAGILRRPGGLRLNILRTNDFLSPTQMTVLVDRTGSGVDQPYVQVSTTLGGGGVGQDRVFVGDNDFNAAAGATATIDQSQDGANAVPPPPSNFTTARLETRTTFGQDLPAIRPAIHPDGTIYSLFYRWTSSSGANMVSDVVVVRDDGWGQGATPFTALTDPSDGLAGRLVVTGRAVPFNTGQAFGQERLVASNLSIAVDPRNSSTLYIAWAEMIGTTYTLFVRRSLDRGVTWSADLRTIASATNPALAVNSRGTVGFMYQELTGAPGAQRFVTHLERTSDAWATAPSDMVLATVPANAPPRVFGPYLGDYVHLMALGKTFYGIFSANNTPDNANFPNGVIYQRNANFTTQTLLDLDGITPVPISIDPYFVRHDELDPAADFYVRDWTLDPTSADAGQEPSTYPWFYVHSDVWNRRTNAPGGFNANDQPQNEEPQVSTLGDNFGFVRVRRNVAGSAEDVAAHFLYSEFGTGSNYQDAGTNPDPVISFGAADLVNTPASGYQWQLPPTSSTHLCFAVEISTANDPIVLPSLLGGTPGWPTTDLAVINDNNKAQRNMGVYPVQGTGSVCFYGLVHNAATFPRDVTLRVDMERPVQRRLRRLRLEPVGSGAVSFQAGGSLVLPGLQPGENRWVGLTFDVPSGEGGELLPVMFSEMVGNQAVSGFAIAARPLPLPEVARANLELHAATFLRVAASFGLDRAREEGELAVRLLRERAEIAPDRYLDFLREHVTSMGTILTDLVRSRSIGDPFRTGVTLRTLRAAVTQGDLGRAVAAHTCLMHRTDAMVTMLQKQGGDVADILQTVRWQRELYGSVRRLADLPAAQVIGELSDRFVEAYPARQATNDDYPRLIREFLTPFRETADALQDSIDLAPELAEMDRTLDSLAALQRIHRAYLLKLQGLPG